MKKKLWETIYFIVEQFWIPVIEYWKVIWFNGSNLVIQYGVNQIKTLYHYEECITMESAKIKLWFALKNKEEYFDEQINDNKETIIECKNNIIQLDKQKKRL